MDYSYTFQQISPKQLYVQIKYEAAGYDPIYKNLSTTDFNEDSLKALAESVGRAVVETWLSIDLQPDTSALEGATYATAFTPTPPPLNIVHADPPYHDPFTQKLQPIDSHVDDGTLYGYTYRDWEVVDKSPAEQTEYLEEWRLTLSSTMRQARLALKQQGLLANVQSNINALPEESQIEWEYGSVVERNSPLVASLGAALGLTETQLDDLFKLAVTL